MPINDCLKQPRSSAHEDASANSSLVVRDGQIKLDKSKSKRTVTNAIEYLEAFSNVMAAIQVAAQRSGSDKAQSLEQVRRALVFNATAISLFRTFTAVQVISYLESVRAEAARQGLGGDLSQPLASGLAQLNKFVLAKQRTDSTSSSSDDSSKSKSAQRDRARDRSRSRPKSTELCKNFNAGKCTYPVCKFVHACSKCGSADHGFAGHK